MTPFAFALIASTIISTSFISGLFGMAGGMILVGVLLVYFDVATAHGDLLDHPVRRQRLARRAVVALRALAHLLRLRVGAVLSFAVMRYVAIVPSKAVVYLGLGAAAVPDRAACPRGARPNIEWRGVPFVTGVLTTVIQLLTGVGGLFLDIFFQKSMLDRKTTIATKAVTQTFSHVVRAVYFGSFVGIADAVPLWTYVPAIVLSIAGTSLAAQVLERMTDVGFRQWTRRVIFAVSVDLSGARRDAALRRLDVTATGSPTRCARSTARRRPTACARLCAGLSERSSIDFAVRRLSSFAITSPSGS